MPSNRYLDRMSMKHHHRDMRNPYGSRGGYVDSRSSRDYRDYNYNSRDYRDHNYNSRDFRDYDMAYNDSKYSSGYDGRGYHEYRTEGYRSGGQQFGQHPRNMGYEMYGVGGIRPREDYRDYGMDDVGHKYRDDLKEWCKKLKKHDKFDMPKEEILQQAKQMGIKFDMFDEEEFLCTYYMMMSDYKMEMLNSPQAYMVMAKSFLIDPDSELQGSEKLCAYMYEIVKGGEFE